MTSHTPAKTPTEGPPSAPGAPEFAPGKKVAIFVVAQDAVAHLSKCLDRIPERVRDGVDEIFICDAASSDDTYLVGVGYKAVSGQENFTVVRGTAAGVGASHKDGIEHCRARHFDIVVILHADGKYAPEAIETLIEPLVRGDVDAVFGSRFLEGRSPEGSPAGRQGIPIHKWLAMRFLIGLQKRLFGMDLTDYHCGYRAYSVPAICELPFALNSDSLVFDTEIIGQIQQKGLRVAEVPVPAYTGDETSGLRGVQYVAQVLRALAQFWLNGKGIREYPKFAVAEKYVYRDSPDNSHMKILDLVDRDRQRILDVGCGAGFLSEALAVRGNSVVGVDVRRAEGVDQRVEKFLQVDLDRDPIPQDDGPYDFVMLADVLEHLRDPSPFLAQCRELLADDGRIIVSVPNVAHWSVRGALLFGRFFYTARGILDRTHLRFFTFASIRDELETAGFVIDRVEPTSPPFHELFPGFLGSLLTRATVLGNRVWKELFSYQVILRAHKRQG